MGKVSVSVYGKPEDIAKLLTESQRPPQIVNMSMSSDAVAKRIVKLLKQEGLAAFGEPLDYSDVQQALRQFAIRVAEKEDATPAELQAMAKVAPL